MIRQLTRMPPGTLGFEAVGKVSEEDYGDVLVPAVSAAADSPTGLRLLLVLGDDFDSYSPGAMWSDTKLWAGNRKAWKRVAVVTDRDWVENAVKTFGWLMPGKVRRFDTDDVEDAKAWLVDIDVDDDD